MPFLPFGYLVGRFQGKYGGRIFRLRGLLQADMTSALANNGPVVPCKRFDELGTRDDRLAGLTPAA
jgi:hypothetical protein